MPTFPPRGVLDREAGFSLMEILVVLAIMGLMLSVVSVRLVRTIESAYFSKTADAAMADLLLLRADAVLTGQSRILITDTSRLQELNDFQKKTTRRFNLPEGWSANGEQIFISRTGACFGGNIAIADNEGRRAVYTLTPPRCKVVRAGAAAIEPQSSDQLLQNP